MSLILFEQEDWEEGACCVLSSPVRARFGLSLLCCWCRCGLEERGFVTGGAEIVSVLIMA